MTDNQTNILTIKEVSRLLNVPESTLRFWQEKEIFSIHQGDNGYRMYSVSDLVFISEIAFYRNLGMPIRDMKHFHEFTLEKYEEVLDILKEELASKLSMYQSMLDSARLKSQHVEDIHRLKNIDYIYDTVPFEIVVAFSYDDREKLIQYTKNPSLYTRCMNSRDLEHDMRGIICDQAGPRDTLLWKKDGASGRYASFLVEEIPSENYRNNIPEKLALIHQKHDTGILLVNFLLSETRDGKRIDYMKAYAELL